MAFTFQEFAIAWSQPPNKTRCTAFWGTTGCLAWSLPWQPSCCASWWLGWHKFRRHERMWSFPWELLGRPVEQVFFGVSMAAWLDDLCQWRGGELVERDFHLGDLLGRDVGAMDWWPDVILEPSPSISGGARLLAQNGPGQESHWRSTSVPWTLTVKLWCGPLFCCELVSQWEHMSSISTCTQKWKMAPSLRTRTMRSHWKTFCDVLRLYLTRSYQKGYETWEVRQLHTCWDSQ